MRMLDRTDARILLAWDSDPLATTVGLSRDLGLARNTVQARQRRMEADDSLAPPSTRTHPARLGYPLLAFVRAEISQGDVDQAVRTLIRIPEILELHATTGDHDILARVVATDADDLHRVTRQMLRCPEVMRTSTALAMRELIPYRTATLLSRLANQP